MSLEVVAPAKLNLVLEVTGRRPDGYHEIRTVMQTIEPCDRIVLRPSSSVRLSVHGTAGHVPIDLERNLASRAATALASLVGSPGLGVDIQLHKSIPAVAGLGGGSSDAAAVLRGLRQLWELDISGAELLDLAASLGSDVPFFLHCGTALVKGRGEHVEPLPDIPPLEGTLFLSDISLEEKTRRMYADLVTNDFSSGDRSKEMARKIRQGAGLESGDLHNVFDSHLQRLAPVAAEAMRICREAGVRVVVAGSGPGFFSPLPRRGLPAGLVEELQAKAAVKALPCRSLKREAAVAVRGL